MEQWCNFNATTGAVLWRSCWIESCELHGSNLRSGKTKENFPLKLVLMTPQTICGSIYETSAGWNYSYTRESKLMDQLKVFVGMAIFLSQMATSRGITSGSNSAPYQQTVSLRGENGPTLYLSPQCRGSSERAREQQQESMLFCTYYSSHTVPSVGCCCNYSAVCLTTEAFDHFKGVVK